MLIRWMLRTRQYVTTMMLSLCLSWHATNIEYNSIYRPFRENQCIEPRFTYKWSSARIR